MFVYKYKGYKLILNKKFTMIRGTEEDNDEKNDFETFNSNSFYKSFF